jgi:mannitol operon transcriptional antiterminator
MKDIKINLRAKSILQKICMENNYVTISGIANELGVSSRTILRELPVVESWLDERGHTLDKKTGIGIRVKGTLEDRQSLISMLNEQKEEVYYSPEERKVIICCELLRSQSPAKLYNFTRILKVTESTVSNDLDKVEQWLGKYGITMIRKPGLGVYIEGREDKIRKAAVDIIYENIGEEHLLNLIRGKALTDSMDAGNSEVIVRSRLLNLVSTEAIRKLDILVRDLEKNIGYRLTDNAYLGLIVHLAILIERINKNEAIKINEKFLEELKKSREFSIAKDFAAEVSKKFHISMPDEEIGYLAMHIKGAKNYAGTGKAAGKALGNFELVKLSKEIIKIAENETGRFLGHNEKLLVGLVNHLGPAISRLRMDMEIRNPLLEEIKTYYADLFKVSEKCAEAVEKYLQKKMPESEIAFIAMHLGAAIENTEITEKRIFRTVIACASGISTSRLLATRVEKEYDNVEVVDVVSTIHLEEGWLREKGIEFIISTVKINNSPLPVVTVNPLLFKEDKEKINKQLRLLERTTSVRPIKKKSRLSLKEKIALLNSYGKAVAEILDNFFLYYDEASSTVEEVIVEASKIIGEDKEQAEKLVEAIKAREEKGGTFLTGHGILLLHSRVPHIDRLYFGAVKPRNLIKVINAKGEEENLELAVVLVAPENCSKNFIETISYVSRMLFDRPEFTMHMKAGANEDAVEELNNFLEEFYKNKCSKYMEG